MNNLKELFATRSGQERIPEGKTLEELLLVSPIIIPRGGMKAPKMEKGKIKYGYDTHILSGKPDETAGSKHSSEFQLTYLLDMGVIVTILGPTEYIIQNINNLSSEEYQDLMNSYAKGLNECDLMLLLYRLGNITSHQLFRDARREIESKFGRSIEVMLQTLRFPEEGNSLVHFSSSVNNLPYSSRYGLVSKHVESSWIGVMSGTVNMFFLTQLNYDQTDLEANPFYLLREKAKSYKDSKSLLLSIVRHFPMAAIQCYRMGNLVMTKEYTEAILYYIQEATVDDLDDMINAGLVLMGGIVQSDEKLKQLIKDAVDRVLKASDLELAMKRFEVFFAYLSSTTSIPNCIIDIDIRKAGYNTLAALYHLINIVRGQDRLNAGTDEEIHRSYETHVALIFRSVRYLMNVPTTRLHEHILSTFNKLRFFVTVDTERPLESEYLDIFQDRYLLHERRFVTTQYFKDTVYDDELRLSLKNAQDSVVVIPKPTSDDPSERIDENKSSIYLIYDINGVVVSNPFNTTNEIREEILSIMDSMELEDILAIPSSPADEGFVEPDSDDKATIKKYQDIKRIKSVVTPAKLTSLKFNFYHTPDSQIYINNMTGQVLSVFDNFKRSAPAVKEPQTSERTIWTEEDLYRSQTINLRQYLSNSETIEKSSKTDLKAYINILRKYKEELDRYKSKEAREKAEAEKDSKEGKDNKDVRESKEVLKELRKTLPVKKITLLEKLLNGKALKNIDSTLSILERLDLTKLIAELVSYRNNNSSKKVTKAPTGKKGSQSPTSQQSPKSSQSPNSPNSPQFVDNGLSEEEDLMNIAKELFGEDSLDKKNIGQTIDTLKEQKIPDMISIIKAYGEELRRVREKNRPLSDKEKYDKFKVESKFPEVTLDKLYNEGYFDPRLIEDNIAKLTRFSERETITQIDFLTREDMKTLVRILLNKEADKSEMNHIDNLLKNNMREEERKVLQKRRDEIEARVSHVLSIPSRHPVFGSAKIELMIAAVSQAINSSNISWKKRQTERTKQILDREQKLERKRMEEQRKKEKELKEKQRLAALRQQNKTIASSSDESSRSSTSSDESSETSSSESDDEEREKEIEKDNEIDRQFVRKEIETILPFQKKISDLISFGVKFEGVLTSFLGDAAMGKKTMITSVYGDNERNKKEIDEKLKIYNTESRFSIAQIINIYRLQAGNADKTPPPVITYEEDYTHDSRIIPKAELIQLINPGYFLVTKPCSMLDNNDLPRFINLNLSRDEVFVLAYMERTRELRDEFERLVTVLYHLQESMQRDQRRDINERDLRTTQQKRDDYDSIKSLFLSILSKSSVRAAQQYKRDNQ